jgi:hypothetical protein
MLFRLITPLLPSFAADYCHASAIFRHFLFAVTPPSPPPLMFSIRRQLFDATPYWLDIFRLTRCRCPQRHFRRHADAATCRYAISFR